MVVQYAPSTICQLELHFFQVFTKRHNNKNNNNNKNKNNNF